MLVQTARLLGLTLVINIVSCASTVPGAEPSLSGSVAFPASRQTQATTADVATAATVSLIDPTYSRTIATTLTNPDGTFSLTLSNFKPQVKTYYLEAIKGLNSNQAGNDAARLRTLVRWNGTFWSALTTNDASIGLATTGLSAIVAVRALDPEPFVGTLATDSTAAYGYRFNGGTDLTFSQSGSSRTVTQTEFSSVADLANQALTADRDPLYSVRYVDATYTLRPLTTMPFIYFALPNPASGGDPVTLKGGNFSPTTTENTVKLNGLPVTVLSADVETLVLRLPVGATTGTLEVGTTAGTGSCPLKVTPQVTGGLSTGPVPTPSPASGTDISGNLLGKYRIPGGRP